jgi:hypothetical protein
MMVEISPNLIAISVWLVRKKSRELGVLLTF